VLAFGARPVLAHHGGAAFDQANTQTLTGTVTRMDFVNPHVVVYFNVKGADGATTEVVGLAHRAEQAPACRLDKHTLNPGDKVTVTGNQQKNGSPVLQIRKIAGPDGKELPTFES
jgi:hypothetical protein